jgi:hypothetical protein
MTLVVIFRNLDLKVRLTNGPNPGKKQFSIFILLKNCKFEELYDSLKRVDSSLKIRFLSLSPKICQKNRLRSRESQDSCHH